MSNYRPTGPAAVDQLGETLVEIGMALGLPRSGAGRTAILARIAEVLDGVPEFRCPSCGATTRARMADAPVRRRP